MKTYKHVVILGIDGAGNFTRFADTPNIDRIFEHGAKTDYCLTAVPTISAQCWGTMLLGVVPYVHRLNNDIISSTPYTDTENPTIFSLVRRAHPDAVLGSFSSWKPINYGIVEQDVGVTTETGEDAVLTEKIIDYIKAEKPELLFVQFESIDHAGHCFGYGSEEYLSELSVVDSYVGRIYASLTDAGIADDTLFIVTADHGGTGHSHGGLTEGERFVLFRAVGKTVADNPSLDLRVIDIPAIVCTALGVPFGRNFDSYVPRNFFSDYKNPPARPVGKTDADYMPARETPPFGALKPKTAFFFDGEGEDGIETTGKVYYTKGVHGSAVRVSGEGFVTLGGAHVGSGSFTLSLWFRVNSSKEGRHVILANKDLDPENSSGFALSFVDSLQFRLAQAGHEWVTHAAFDCDPVDSWTHVAVSVDKETLDVSTYVNFKLFETHKMPEDYAPLTFDNEDGLPLRLGNDGTGTRPMLADVTVDDLFIFDKALNANDIKELELYYE